ncbi:translocation/assembly module TamB domain-containing protein [Nitratireductor sp. XY-223]|uniref:translocation/assembly module TamB domain-containing protein n=1 Tax=Nitratireductor sp. XY-223 TaxID=2561926 RepID=UPI0010A9C4AA|nr:translocation/assembly module TamB domain-containing protein [Nitratireductor sp. XY-223]
MKTVLRLLIVLILIVAAVLLAALALVGTGPGLSLTASMIGSAASGQGRTVIISDLEGVIGGSPRIGQITVADETGTWLVANDVEADIALGRLLTGAVDVSRLHAGTVAVSRRPVASRDAQTGGGAPSLPAIPIRVDNIFLRSIDLAEPVLGEKAALQLTGSVLLRDSPVDMSGTLDILRIDGTAGEVSAAWKISPDSNELELKLNASEPADGLVARALNIYGLPAVNVDLSGSGPLDAWQANLAVELDGEKTVEGDVSLSITDQRQAVDGVLKGYLAPLVPRRLAPLFAGDTQIELTAERDGENTVRLEKLNARSALLSIAASGNVLASENSVDLTADIEFGSDGSQVAFQVAEDQSLDIGHVQLSSSLKGSLEEAEWSLNGSVKSLSDGRISVEDAVVSGRSSNVNFLAVSGEATVELSAQSVTTGQDTVDGLIAGSPRISADGTLQGSQITFKRLDLVTSSVDATATGQVNVAERYFDMRLQAKVNAPTDTPLPALLGSRQADLSGRATRQGDGALVLTDLSLESDNLTASGSGELGDGSIAFNSRMSLTDLSRFRQELQGGFNIELGLSGQPAAPDFSLNAQGVDISLLDKPLEDFSVSASGVASADRPRADLKVDGRYEGHPVTVSASVSGGDGVPVVETLDLTVPGARATGKVNADTSGILTGQLDVDITSLEELGPLILQEGLSGSASGTVTFAGVDGKQNVTAKLTSPDFATGPVSANGLVLDVVLEDLREARDLSASATASSVTISGTEISDARASISGGPEQMPFSVSGTVFNAPMSMEGELSSQHGTTTVEVSEASATFRSVPVRLSEPVSLTIAQSGANVETATLRVGGGTIVVKGTAGDELDFDVAVNSFPVALFENVAPTGLGQNGTLSGTATISGNASDPTVSYDLRVANFSVEASRGARMPSLSVQSSGRYQSNRLTLNTQASGSGIDFNITGSVDIADGQRLDLKVSGKAPLELATLPAAEAGVQLEGTAQVSVAITGSARSPAISGTLTTTGADFIETNTALTIRDINANITFDGSTARVSQLTGRLGSGGTITVTGSVQTDPSTGLPADLTITVRNGTYTNSEIVTAQFDADLKVEGALLRSGKIGGTISLERTDISIPDKLPASIPFIDVKHIHAPRRVVEQARELEPRESQSGGTEADAGGLQLDISVNSPARIFLRGRGIDAEFGGSVDVTGSSRAPRVKGTFTMVRGRIDLLTKRFSFDSGSITFAGPLDPSLNFTATTTRGSTSYSIVVTGTASDPEINFTSSPSLPEDEILANLFFGKSLSNLSAIQIAQIANALASLGGANTRGGVLDRLRNLTGLADIDINTDQEDGSTSIGIGRYINDRTYLNVEQGVSGGSGRVTIDMDLTDHLKARGEADTDGNSKAGIFFERDY